MKVKARFVFARSSTRFATCCWIGLAARDKIVSVYITELNIYSRFHRGRMPLKRNWRNFDEWKKEVLHFGNNGIYIYIRIVPVATRDIFGKLEFALRYFLPMRISWNSTSAAIKPHANLRGNQAWDFFSKLEVLIRVRNIIYLQRIASL